LALLLDTTIGLNLDACTARHRGAQAPESPGAPFRRLCSQWCGSVRLERGTPFHLSQLTQRDRRTTGQLEANLTADVSE
jgi:hypothetical protein